MSSWRTKCRGGLVTQLSRSDRAREPEPKHVGDKNVRKQRREGERGTLQNYLVAVALLARKCGEKAAAPGLHEPFKQAWIITCRGPRGRCQGSGATVAMQSELRETQAPRHGQEVPACAEKYAVRACRRLAAVISGWRYSLLVIRDIGFIRSSPPRPSVESTRRQARDGL